MEDFTLVRTNLSQQIAEHLEEVILSSKFSKVDEKLPSELALSRQYNVSRPVIREALKLLQERGLVVMKNGAGAYVTKPETDTIMQAVNRIMQMGNISSEDLAQVRAILEISSAKKAAQNASEAQLSEIAMIAESMKDPSLSLKQRVEKDSSFHISIAKASGNKLLETFLQVIAPLLPDYMGKGVLLPGGIEDGVHRHSLLVEALKSRSPENAAKAMREHLDASRDNVREFDSRLSKKPRS
jgi:DNA-binding FadR family transcriptional regulator